jgi:hypothetical protein
VSAFEGADDIRFRTTECVMTQAARGNKVEALRARFGRAAEAAPEFPTSVLAGASNSLGAYVFQTTAGSFDIEVRRVIEDHQAFYEVTPYYVLFEERPRGYTSSRRIQAGFDVDVFGIVKGPAPQPSPEYELVYQALSRLADAIRPPTSDGCSIEVISLASTIILDPRLHFQPEATLRIRIAHSRGLDQPAGPAEERTLQKLQEQLRSLGVKAGGGR